MIKIKKLLTKTKFLSIYIFVKGTRGSKESHKFHNVVSLPFENYIQLIDL